MNFAMKICSVITLLVAVVIIVMGVYSIDEGERGVVLSFGEIVDTASEPGLHLKMPWQNVQKFNVRVQKAVFGNSSNPLSAYSYDQQIIESYRISITFKYDEAKVNDIYRNFNDSGSDLFKTVVSPTVQQISKAIFGQYTAVTIVQERLKLEKDIESALRNALKQYPVVILSTQLEDVNFSETYESIIEQTALKKQEIEKAQNELQRVEIESKQQIAKAEAANKAIKLKADADAYRIEVKAKAEANAIEMRGKALTQNPDLVKLTVAERWDGKLPVTTLSNDNVLPLLNITQQK